MPPISPYLLSAAPYNVAMPETNAPTPQQPPQYSPHRATRRGGWHWERTVVITLLLIGGTVVNIAVAWWLNGRAGIGQGTLLYYRNYGREFVVTASRLNTIGYTRFAYFEMRVEDWPQRHSWISFGNEREAATLEEVIPRRVGERDGRPLRNNYEAAGLPLRTIDASDLRLQLDVTEVVNIYEMAIGRTTLRSSVRLPLTPIWPGFAINTLFYALLLWLLLFGPFAARRALRRKRRLCEKCAYPIGTSPVCTECGAAVRASTS